MRRIQPPCHRLIKGPDVREIQFRRAKKHQLRESLRRVEDREVQDQIRDLPDIKTKREIVWSDE